MKSSRLLTLSLFTTVILCLPAITAGQIVSKPSGGSPQDVLTYHGDNLRTGWFSSETLLTTSNVNSQSFGLLQTVTLDGRVDAEPLVALQQSIDGHGVHDVVYIATENNTVYALDANDGSTLWQRNFGTPVPYQYKDWDDNVYPVMGILGTPVIDRTLGAIYVVADLYNGSRDAFQLRAISLSNGKDLIRPVFIGFSQKLLDGTTWTFDPKYHLQRAGLVEANGSIYVSFGSNGDIDPSISRGNIVRYDAAALTRLAGVITDRLGEDVTSYYLSAIWQSGYAPAADQGGDIYFSTGNSDYAKGTYSANGNRPDSMLRISGDLKKLRSSFTTYNYFELDEGDHDMGSGGMMLLPDQPGSTPHLAIAGGKDGRAFLLNRDHLGGYTEGGPDKVVQIVDGGPCWCGPAYFVGADGVPRVLTGGNIGITSWKLQTSPSAKLTFDSTTGPDPVYGLAVNGGTIPVVSSNGTAPGTGIVWFVQRPTTSSDQDPGTPVTLHAFSAANLSQELFSSPAGTWTHAVVSDANLVPTVANGKVYVASNLQLQIFGLLSGRKTFAVQPPPTPSRPDSISCPSEISPIAAGGTGEAVHQFRGTICKVSGNQLQLALPGQHSVAFDIAGVPSGRDAILLTPGRPIRIRATIDEKGIAHAQRILRSHAIPE